MYAHRKNLKSDTDPLQQNCLNILKIVFNFLPQAALTCHKDNIGLTVQLFLDHKYFLQFSYDLVCLRLTINYWYHKTSTVKCWVAPKPPEEIFVNLDPGSVDVSTGRSFFYILDMACMSFFALMHCSQVFQYSFCK